METRNASSTRPFHPTSFATAQAKAWTACCLTLLAALGCSETCPRCVSDAACSVDAFLDRLAVPDLQEQTDTSDMSESDQSSAPDGIIQPLPSDFRGGHCDAKYPTPCHYTNYDSSGKCYSDYVMVHDRNGVVAKILTSYDCEQLSAASELIASNDRRFVSSLLRFMNYDSEYVTTPAVDSAELIQASTGIFDEKFRILSFGSNDGQHLTEYQYDGDCGVSARIEDGLTLSTWEYDSECKLLNTTYLSILSGTYDSSTTYTWDGDCINEKRATSYDVSGSTTVVSYYECDIFGHYTHVSVFLEADPARILTTMADFEYGPCGLERTVWQSFEPVFLDSHWEDITEYDSCCNIVRYIRNGDILYVYDFSCWQKLPIPDPPWNPLTGSERYPGIWLLGQTEPVIF